MITQSNDIHVFRSMSPYCFAIAKQNWKTGGPWPGGAHLPGRRKNSEQRMFLKKIVKKNINILYSPGRGTEA